MDQKLKSYSYTSALETAARLKLSFETSCSIYISIGNHEITSSQGYLEGSIYITQALIYFEQ